MNKIPLFILVILFSQTSFSQRVHVGLFGGVAAYNGDLTEKIFPKKITNGALGVSLNYELTDKIMLRGGVTYAVVGGADRFSDKPALLERNLSFETSVLEFSAIGEYTIFSLYERRFSPYGFAGLAVYHFNPYAYNNGEKVFLKPLSTEGQGLSGYADRPAYGLTQIAIPFGAGFKFAITDNLRVGVELGMRKLFTDHFDDVSTGYADFDDLLAAKGQLAVDMAYRGDEVAGGNPQYPAKGVQRGSAEFKDWYYFSGIHLTYRLNANGGGAGKKSRLGCPNVPL
jgi:hypothetical protein